MTTLKDLQFKMFKIQQYVWHHKERLIIAIEGFDASGKGGSIRRLTSLLDPRGYRVHPIGPPSEEDQGKHYLYRFWTKIPGKGVIAIFDRTWYGRVLVERVEKLIPNKRWMEAYDEINNFEKALTQDGVHIIKIYLKVSKKEQYKRFEDRANDISKQWKITQADIDARKKWSSYVRAINDMIKRTSTKENPWHIVDGDNKDKAREEVLTIVTNRLKFAIDEAHHKEMKDEQKEMKKLLKKLK